MSRPLLYLAVSLALLAPAALAAPPAKPAAPAAQAAAASPLEPQAVAALQKMGAYLRSLKSFSVHGDTTIDVVTEDGQKLQFPGSVDYKVRTPNDLRLSWKTDRKERELYYDGKTLTVYGPKNKYYASVDAPPTLRALMDDVRDRYGIELPLPDLFLWGTDAAPVSALKSATFVGPARVDGSVTEQYAFRQDGVDWQLWLEAGDKPLPRRLVITTTDDPAQPQYSTTLTWDTNASFKDSAFTFVPPKGAAKIELVEVDVAVAAEDQP
ncbi:MAG TPA: DUF2092 domain-containing protein [Stenotrophomonas sp.]|nr:DUF2092 domain-containing protein [Stenotrophomonas sp.]